jgi:ribokinase
MALMDFAAGFGFSNLDMIYTGIEQLPREGEETLAKDFHLCLGGGIPATMINLSRLGVEAKIGTFLGKDMFSQYVEQQFREYGINYTNLYNGSKIPICISTSMVTPHDRTFMTFRQDIEPDDSLYDRIYSILQGAKVVEMHVGFSEVYKRLKKEGTILVFDNGWDEQMSLEKYREYLETADYYVPNKKEALKITGTDSIEEAAKILSQFFSDVVIKLDRDGCYYYSRDTRSAVVIPSISEMHAIDSTGAGDAFLSGFIYGLMKGVDIQKCILFGNVTGGACVEGIGCLTSYVDEKELLIRASSATV